MVERECLCRKFRKVNADDQPSVEILGSKDEIVSLFKSNMKSVVIF